MSKNKRIVALTSRSGKTLHISSIGKEILSKIKVEGTDALPPSGTGNAPVPHRADLQMDTPQASRLMADLAAAPMPAPSPAGATGKSRRSHITRMCSGADWARHAAMTTEQKQLCGPLWYEGEICILFADTNVGKSILAVQLADMVSRGLYCDTTLPELKPQTFQQPVVYADFELSLAQFSRRYSCQHPDDAERKAYYDFSPQFNRVELYYDLSSDSDAEEFATKEFADMIIADLEQRLLETEAQVLVIDNITFMASGTETAADAMPLMKKLVALKKRHNLSILLLAHTPKRALCNPLTRNDLQGSKMLINFADSAFALGESIQGKDIRYIKQIKQRNCEQVYDRGNVLTCTLGKVYDNFVGFSSIGTSDEESHLAERPGRMSGDRAGEVRERVRMLKAEGKPMSEISTTLGISRTSLYRIMANGMEN